MGLDWYLKMIKITISIDVAVFFGWLYYTPRTRLIKSGGCTPRMTHKLYKSTSDTNDKNKKYNHISSHDYVYVRLYRLSVKLIALSRLVISFTALFCFFSL
ncbi:hypothetical protein F5884DRAFT_87205 [Xylogone sp. PMI_703]|nr:hypothetical protein F5884DRAFT_87205 [Xylogone sp. PMI_703]